MSRDKYKSLGEIAFISKCLFSLAISDFGRLSVSSGLKRCFYCAFPWFRCLLKVCSRRGLLCSAMVLSPWPWLDRPRPPSPASDCQPPIRHTAAPSKPLAKGGRRRVPSAVATLEINMTRITKSPRKTVAAKTKTLAAAFPPHPRQQDFMDAAIAMRARDLATAATSPPTPHPPMIFTAKKQPQ